MKRLALLLLLAACVDTALPVTNGRITNKADFLATVGGKTVSNAGTAVVIGRDGRFAGTSNGAAISGTWDFRDGFWCRAVTEPAAAAEECQVWVVRGDTVAITRDSGTGETLLFRIQQPQWQSAPTT